MTDTTATYIGFRTYRYHPVTTRCFVGKIGAGVPRPWSANRANESRSTGRPARINTTPMIRNWNRPKKGGSNCQREIHHGTKPATTQGAITKNRRDPRMAEIRLTPASF